MTIALRLAWIPRTFDPRNKKLENGPRLLPKKIWRFELFNDLKYTEGLPLFYKDILTFFNELKKSLLLATTECKTWSYLISKKLFVGGKPVFTREWFDSNVLSIKDLLNSNGQLLSFQEFKNKHAYKTNFLQFYQVISAIPKYLVIKTRNAERLENRLYTANNFLFRLNDYTQMQLEKAKNRDFMVY